MKFTQIYTRVLTVMAKHKHSKKPKVKPNKSVLKRRVSDKAKIEELIRAQPNWWEMKTR